MIQIRIHFQRNGVEKSLGVGKLSDFEKKLMEKAKKELSGNIESGLKFAKQYLSKSK